LRDEIRIEVHWRPKPGKLPTKTNKLSVANQKRMCKSVSAATDVDVSVELYDEDSFVDGSGDEAKGVEVEDSRPKKFSPQAHAPLNSHESQQDSCEGIGGTEQQISASGAEIDDTSKLYRQMCDLRHQVS
jgi:hypothetical protein